MTPSPNWKTRELEILNLLAQGLSNSEIGAQLHLAPDTVRWYNKHIFEKLEVHNRQQAVRRATQLGLLTHSHPPTAPAPTRLPVRYIANGNVHIAYQVIGNGPVDLLFIHGFLSHLELAWENPEFTSFFEQLGRFARVILFDKRGMGLSDRIQGAPTLENTIEDARYVLDAVGSERAFVMGTSEGGAAAVLLAATYPERVRGLILYAAIAKAVQTNNEPAWASPPEQFERMIQRMQETWGGPWALESFAPSRAQEPEFRSWWATILRSASSPSSIRAVLSILREVDIRPLLPQVRVNTLVIHKTHDRLVNIEAGRYFAEHLPNATWVELPGADHIYFIDCDAILSAIAQFCQQQSSDNPSDSWIATVLYAQTSPTDTLARQVTSQLNTYGAKSTTYTPQGVIALFDSPTRALRCALALRDLTHRESIRISLHVGECQVASGKPSGPVLEIASLAAMLADPGQVIITRTLRDILAGSGFSFEERYAQSVENLLPSLPLYSLV